MITIISRPEFRMQDGNREYVKRISARLRGEEVANFLNYPFNPEKPEGVCLWIKPRSLRRVKDGDYVDVLDGRHLIDLLKERPKVKVIAMSQVHYEYLKHELANKIVLIYHHHLNFERKRHIRNLHLVGGFIGSPSSVAYQKFEEIKQALSEIDVDFTHSFHFTTREEMIDYYMSIDFLVIFNLNQSDENCFYRHPTKILNAASFGIPALAQPIAGYREVEGFYLPIKTLQDITTSVNKLKDEKFYKEFSDKIFYKAEKYHISKTTEIYKTL